MSSRVRIDFLHIRKFRHLVEPVELSFVDASTLVVGRNGTGKTNLLLLLDAVARLDFSEFENDAVLDLSFELRWDELRLHMELAHTRATVERPARTAFRGWSEVAGRNRVDFEVDGVVVKGGHLNAQKLPAPSPFQPAFARELARILSPTPDVRFLATARETGLWPLVQHAAPVGMFVGRLDEGVEVFRAITDPNRPDHATTTIYLHDADRRDLVGWYGTPLSLARWLQERGGDGSAELTEADLPWLGIVAEACGFDALRIILHRPALEAVNDITAVTYGPFSWYASRGRNGFSHSEFSYGQKRIVAAFWLLATVRDAGGVLLADELVNGLHHRAVELVLGEVGDLQAVFASQSPLLFDFMVFDSAEDFRRRFIRCDLHEDGWTWRNPTEDEARQFMGAYETGIQHVSEILRDEGLW